MQQPGILLVYGTKYGHTEKIIEHMAAEIRRHGGHATTVPGDDIPSGFQPEIYQGIIVAASVIGGRHQKYIEAFVRQHVELLNQMPTAFFSVSGSAGSPKAQYQDEAFKLAKTFVDSLGWHPAKLETIAGEIAYTRYWFGLRFVMRMIAKKQGEATDTSHDIDLTDWMEVDRMALDFLTCVQHAEATASSPAGA